MTTTLIKLILNISFIKFFNLIKQNPIVFIYLRNVFISTVYV